MQEKEITYMKAIWSEDNLGRTNSDYINRETAFFVMKSLFYSQGKQTYLVKSRLEV